jgi:hypothetical protein
MDCVNISTALEFHYQAVCAKVYAKLHFIYMKLCMTIPHYTGSSSTEWVCFTAIF